MSGFPERLRAARKAAGLTQEELGFQVGVTKASVSAWETGREVPGFRLLPMIREALGQSLDLLVCGITPDGVREDSASAAYLERARSQDECRFLLRFRRLEPARRKALLVLMPEERRKGAEPADD